MIISVLSSFQDSLGKQIILNPFKHDLSTIQWYFKENKVVLSKHLWSTICNKIIQILRGCLKFYFE